MRQTAKLVLKSILQNWITFLWFEIVYRIIGFTVVYPLLGTILSTIRTIVGVSYIALDNIMLIFLNPLAIVLLICIFLLFTYYVYFEIVALILYCEAGWRSNRISILKLWRITCFKSIQIFYYKNLPIFLGLLPVIALSLFRLTSSVLNQFRIPEFIMEFIMADQVLSIIFAGILLLINFLLFLYLFGIPSVILNGENFISSWRVSLCLLRRKKKKTLMALIACAVFDAVCILFAAALAVLLLFLYSSTASEMDQARYLFWFHGTVWQRIGTIIIPIFISVTMSAVTVVLYHQYRNDIPFVSAKMSYTIKNIVKSLVAVCCVVLLLIFYSETELGGNKALPEDTQTKIIAHRAGGGFAPENTIAALEGAIRDQADMAEIDVQQTMDGTLIVMHDTNFSRTAYVDRNVWETDYETVKTFEVGSSFSPSFAGEQIPTLSQMLATAKNRINLMIELKSTGYEQNLEQAVITLIHQYHMKQQCAIASMNLDLLKRVKQIDPDIKTAYISAVLLSEQYDMEYVDGYSVETTFLSREMTVQAHFQGKQIYGWTANSAQTIKKILYSGADGLVTDNPLLAEYYLKDTGENSLLMFLTDLFYPKSTA